MAKVNGRNVNKLAQQRRDSRLHFHYDQVESVARDAISQKKVTDRHGIILEKKLLETRTVILPSGKIQENIKILSNGLLEFSNGVTFDPLNL